VFRNISVLLATSEMQIVLPMLLGASRWMRGICGIGISFSGNYASWGEALADASGYDADEILNRVDAATSKVASGEAAYERDSVVFDQISHSFPVLAGLLRAAIENGNRLTVLDFGGSLGSSYRQCRPFLAVVPRLEWRIVEQENFVRRGRERFENDQLRFFMSLSEAVAAERGSVDVVLLSSVLQYLERPFESLKELYEVGSRYLIIDRTPFANIGTDRLVVQRVPSSIYPASYPCWIFSRPTFMQSLEPAWEVLANFFSTDGRWIAGRVNFEFSGLILRRRD
jgi:putative methyltransferase (TIGR04325 family)